MWIGDYNQTQTKSNGYGFFNMKRHMISFLYSQNILKKLILFHLSHYYSNLEESTNIKLQGEDSQNYCCCGLLDT
jgi:hypothetical protein